MNDTNTIQRLDRAAAVSGHRFRYYDFAMAATCVIVVCANVIGAGKVAQLAVNLPWRTEDDKNH